MWAHFRFYLAGLLMCIGAVLPAAILQLPEESSHGLMVLVVFFAGGGLLYMIWNLYWHNENGEWKKNHETILRVMSIVSGVIGLGLIITIKIIYGGSDFIFYNVMFAPDKDALAIFLRVVVIIICGISAYPVFCTFTGEIDMSMHNYIRTTYNSSGEVIDTKNVSHRQGDSVVSYFFLTVLLGILAIMFSSIPLAAFMLILNIKNVIPNRIVSKTIFGVGLAASIIYLLVSAFNSYNLVSESKDVYVAMTIMPCIFALLIYFYYLLYTHFEPFSGVLLLIVFTFVMIFIAYIASYGLSIGLSKLFDFILSLKPIV